MLVLELCLQPFDELLTLDLQLHVPKDSRELYSDTFTCRLLPSDCNLSEVLLLVPVAVHCHDYMLDVNGSARSGICIL